MIRLAAIFWLAALCSVSAWALGIGDPAPGLALLNAGGDLVSLERMRGKVIYVDFWASWCGPCRRSFPWMNHLDQRYAKQGLAIIGVNVDKKRTDAERFLQQTPAAFTIVFDAAGVTPSVWGVTGMPSSYLVDRQGNVVAVETGFSDERKDLMEQRIGELLDVR